MNTRVLRIHQIDLNKINYLKIKDIGSKKQVYIDYEKSPLVFKVNLDTLECVRIVKVPLELSNKPSL
jgi:hypothetical protein